MAELRERHKNINLSAKREIKIGELVLISDENLHRHRWRVAEVEELISSKDGYVRRYRLGVTNNKSKIPIPCKQTVSLKNDDQTIRQRIQN